MAASPSAQPCPPERTLATQLGVTRPTLREALQRLARDGWLEIRHGLPTRVRDFWREGNLGVLSAVSRNENTLPPDFIPNLLEVRLALAPSYARLAIHRSPADIVSLLSGYGMLADEPPAYTQADWDLHHALTVGSGNPVYTLILNGFHGIYFTMGPIYFARSRARAHSRTFYEVLLGAADAGDAEAAETITRRVMAESLDLWIAAAAGGTA